jgi:hypothetical protein
MISRCSSVMRCHERAWIGVIRCNDGRITDKSAAVAVAHRSELTRHVLAEQRDVGGVDPVGDRERAALVVAGLREAHMGARPEGDVPQVKMIRDAEPGNQPPKLTDASSCSMPPPLLAKVTGPLPVEAPVATSRVPPLIVTALSMLPDSTSSNPPLPPLHRSPSR